MAVKTIVELQSKPGKRSEPVEIMDGVVAAMRDVPGFRGVTRYEVLDDFNGFVMPYASEPAKIGQVASLKIPQVADASGGFSCIMGIEPWCHD